MDDGISTDKDGFVVAVHRHPIGPEEGDVYRTERTFYAVRGPEMRALERSANPRLHTGLAPYEPLQDVPSLAAYLGASKSKVYKLVEMGQIPHVRIGAHIRFDMAEIRRWIATHRVPATPSAGR